MRLIDADELIKQLVEIRDRKYTGKKEFQKNRKWQLPAERRDQISNDIALILKMTKEN